MTTRQNPIVERLSAALAQRHWEPAVVAQAAGLPEETVRRHLAGETPIATSELQRYASVLGLDPEALLADAALSGVAADDSELALPAAQRLLHEFWDKADAADRHELIEHLRRLRESVARRPATRGPA